MATQEVQTNEFLKALHRGGKHSYWWTPDPRRSSWWHVETPTTLPNGRSNVYFGIHPVDTIPPTNAQGEPKPPEHVRSQINYVTAVNCLFAEFDANDFGGDKAAAWQHVEQLDPEPSAIIDSGGGYHCYWLLDETWFLHDEAERKKASELQADWVEYVQGDDASKDLARVLRVPGTKNYKYEPAREVAFVRCDLNVCYTRDALKARTHSTTPEPILATPRTQPSRAEYLERWARGVKATAIEMVAQAQDHTKHQTRLKAAKLYGGLIPHGLATEAEAEAVLYHAQEPKANHRSELKTIQDAIAYGKNEPLKLPPAPPTPAFDMHGMACCPNGHGPLVQSNNGNGWRCRFFCGFWWDGEGYTPPATDDEQDSSEEEAITPLPSVGTYIPPLPSYAVLPDDLGRDACPWLDEYITFSRQWSPRSYDGYHEACALWLLSTIAARRVVLHLGKKRYTNLYMVLVGRTSLWAKSSGADIASDCIRAAGLTSLLAPDESTPQALIKDMAGHVPQDFDELPLEKQTRTRQRLAFAAQRGWYYDEFGQKLNAMMREGSAMADFRGLLRRLDDCKEEYESITIGRAADVLEKPYLALLANMTPADMAPHARKNGALWGDGFFARMGFICPPRDEPLPTGRFPKGERIIPPSLIMPLQEWHKRLSVPQVELRERIDAKGNGTGLYDANVTPLPASIVTMGEGVYDAFYRYDEALRELAQANENMDLDGNYARLSEKALRIAMLLASLDNNDVIELRHWARAQQIAERLRCSLHHLIETVQHESEASQASQLEDKVLRAIERLGATTIRDIRRHALKSVSTEELEHVLDSLERSGQVRVEKTKKGTKRYHLSYPNRRNADTAESRKLINSSAVCTVDEQHATDPTQTPSTIAREEAAPRPSDPNRRKNSPISTAVCGSAVLRYDSNNHNNGDGASGEFANLRIKSSQSSDDDVLHQLYAKKDLAGLMKHCLEHKLDYLTVLDEFEAAERAAHGGET
jgi:hypothetical protein